MKTIDEFIEELSYYRTVAKTQTDPEILKVELSDLIAESNDFAESLRPLDKGTENVCACDAPRWVQTIPFQCSVCGGWEKPLQKQR